MIIPPKPKPLIKYEKLLNMLLNMIDEVVLFVVNTKDIILEKKLIMNSNIESEIIVRPTIVDNFLINLLLIVTLICYKITEYSLSQKQPVVKRYFPRRQAVFVKS